MKPNKEHKLIQSYVADSFFVSTAFRRASTMEEMWYYECYVWEWDPETKKRGKLIEEHDFGTLPECAHKEHERVCFRLIKEVTTRKDIEDEILRSESET